MAEGKFNIVQSFMILLYSYFSSLIVTSTLPKLLISNIAYVILGLPILGFPTLPILTISLSLNFFIYGIWVWAQIKTSSSKFYIIFFVFSASSNRYSFIKLGLPWVKHKLIPLTVYFNFSGNESK